MRYLVTILIAMIIVIGITSACMGCKSVITTYEVAFDIGEIDADTPSTIVVESGQRISSPSFDCLPTAGFEFAWYTDEERTILFDFSKPIDANIILYLGEQGLIYNISYENVDEAWFEIASLPTKYRAGEVTAIPYPKETAPQKGYYDGNWHIGSRDIGYAIDEQEYGDVKLKFVVNPIVWDIRYRNINRIDLGEDEYAEYIHNDNPDKYKITDGTIILKAPTMDPECPFTIKEFSHWEKVEHSDTRMGDPIEELDIDVFMNSKDKVYLRAVWKYID